MQTKSKSILFLFVLLSLLAAVLLFALPGPADSANSQQINIDKSHPETIWQPVAENQIGLAQNSSDEPTSYLTFRLNISGVPALLAGAPAEIGNYSRQSGTLFTLPRPDGRLEYFHLYESPILDAALSAKFPQIKSYIGRSLDNPAATTRLVWSPFGLNAIVINGEDSYFVTTYNEQNNLYYMSYFHRDIPPVFWEEPEELLEMLPESELQLDARDDNDAPGRTRAPYDAGSTLRVFRLVTSATGEFSQAHGGTVDSTLAFITGKVSQFNAILERELATRLIIVDGSDQVIFLDGATDPYTEGCDLGTYSNHTENQTTVDATIGTENYDLGHLFMRDLCGGVVSGPLCGEGGKARGSTGAGIPVDILAHEVGHQFGMDHTWSLCNGATGGQYRANAAYEPGSGSTMMAYPGICGADNVTDSRDLQYHVFSFDQGMSRITEGVAEQCGYYLDIDHNTAPTANAGSDNIYLPPDTPFVLAGSATDPDGDALTYSWEELDLAPATGSAPNNGVQPFFRVFAYTDIPTRTFPQISDVVNNTETLGEELITYPFTSTFRLQVLDNVPGGGGHTYNEITVRVVTETAGLATIAPFQVITPNLGSEIWTPGGSETVDWNVANTDQAPISCSTVNIDLSLDGGFTYPINLATDTANDGSETVSVPAGLQSVTARVRVRCSMLPDHFFFDISDADFTVGSTIPPAGCITSTVVRSLANSGACSLRDSIASAAPGTTITFDAILDNNTIVLTEPITITQGVTIDGSGVKIAVSGDDSSRLFYVDAGGADVDMQDFILRDANGGSGSVIRGNWTQAMTLTRMLVDSNYSTGSGGIYKLGGTLNIIDSTFSGNEASQGGAVWQAFGTLNIYGSTFDSNSGYSNGPIGGAISSQDGTINVYNSTFSGNTGWRGAAIGAYNSTPVVNIYFSTLVGNSAGADWDQVHSALDLRIENSILGYGNAGQDDCGPGSGTLTSVNNLIEDGSCSATYTGDPQLGPLQDNGGNTETRALKSTSPALDKAALVDCAAAPISNLDQRDNARPSGSLCDLGAYERTLVSGPDVTISKTVTPTAIIEPGDTITYVLTYENIGDALATNVVITDTINSVFTPTAYTSSGAAISLRGGTTYVWDVADLTPGSGGIITVTGTTSKNAYFQNEALITASSDTDTSNDNSSPVYSILLSPPRLVVDKSGDTWDGDYSLNENNLREAIFHAPAGSTITFAPAVSGQTAHLNGEIVISKDLTIDATGVNFTVSGDTNMDTTPDVPVFRVIDNATVTFINLTIERGTEWTGGGLDTEAGTSVTLLNMTFQNNGGQYGAALLNRGTLTMTNSIFLNNNATGNGGALENNGAMIIDSSHFEGNTAADHGGALHAWGGSLTIQNSTVITDNMASNSGGAISIRNGATVTMTNSTMANNQGNFGGAAYCNGTSLNISNSTVSGNQATSEDGGGFYFNGCDLTADNVDILNNDAGDETGGAFVINATGRIDNSLIQGNTAARYGGGFAAYGSSAQIYITNTQILSNTANAGGGVSSRDSAFTLTDVTIRGNQNNSTSDGGGIHAIWSNNSLAINSSTIYNNESLQRGGGIHFESGTLTVTNSTIVSNTAATEGGAIINISGQVNVSDSDLNRNHAGTTGGAIASWNGPAQLTITGSRVMTNTTNGDGGGIRVQSGDGTIIDTLIQNNDADDEAGGYLMIGGTSIISRTTIINNGAARNGGGIGAFSGNLTVAESLLQGNVLDSNSDGGGMLITSGAVVTILDTTIDNNNGLRLGGGIALWSGQATVIRSTISNNQSTNFGAAGVFVSDSGNSIALYNSTISGNQAGRAGGMYVQSGGAISLTNSTVVSNTGSGFVGGIENNGSSVTIQNTIIANNSSSSRPDCSGTINTLGNNLVENLSGCGFTALPSDVTGFDPLLLPLADNGGPTLTHAFQPTSPALDAGDNTACAAAEVNGVDQRGVGRPLDGDHDGSNDCDIGAYEYNIFIWDGGGGANDDWSLPANWIGDLNVPTANHEVIFNGTSNTNALVDGAFAGSVFRITVENTYGSIISLTRQLTVSDDIVLTRGILSQNSHSMTIGGDLTVATAARLDVGTGSLTVDGTFTNNGQVVQTRDVTAVGVPVEFLHIWNQAGSEQKYYGLTMTPTDSSMGAVTLQLTAAPCSSPLMNRCYDITPTTAATATIRFYFSDADRIGHAVNNLELWHDNPSTGYEMVGTNYQHSESTADCQTANGIGCWFQADGIDSYSPFGLGEVGDPAPTAILLGTINLAASPPPLALVLALGLFIILGAGTTYVAYSRRRNRTV